MKRLSWFTIVILGAASGGFALAEEAKEAKPVPVSSAADADRVAREEEKRVLGALSRKITFECADMSIEEAVLRISEAIDCEFLVDNQRLADEGISTENSTSFKIGEMTAWQILHFVLKPNLLTWVANDGVLEITTRTHGDEVLVTRVYDVHKLCQQLEPLTREMLLQQPRARKNPGGRGGMMGGGGGGGMFSVPATALGAGAFGQMGGMGLGMQPGQQGPMIAMSVEAVLAAMIVNCTSLKWIDRDGDGGSVQLGQGCLVVSQSYHGQFEIAGILQALEKLVDGKFAGKSTAARRIGYPAEEEARIFEILAKPRTIEVESDSIDQVIRQIAKNAGLPVWFDVQTMSSEGISADAAVGPRRKMRKVPLGVCLKKILDPLQLAWVVDEGALVITTQSHAAEMMSVRFYDISGISKIANGDPDSGVVSILSRSTHGNWQDFDGDGGAASLVSSKHLAVRHTQQVHTEIELLIDDLTKDELIVPAEPALEIRVYTASNVETARDLERLLPQLLETRWSGRGSIRIAGESLFINQPPAVHDRLEEIMAMLEQSHGRKNPAAKDADERKTPER